MRPWLSAKISFLLALAVSASSRGAPAAEKTVECRVVQETVDGIYVDAGSEDGLVVGAGGIVLQDGAEIARVEVVLASRTSALLKFLTQAPGRKPRPGDRAVLKASTAAGSEEKAAGGKDEKPAARATPEEKPFVPLLAPPGPSVGTPEVSNLFHGRLRAREMFQVDSKGAMDYSITRLGSDGSLDRMGGTPWAFEWSGDLSYRAGDAFQGTEDFEDLRLDVFRLSLFRRFEKGGFLRLGRFLPAELPGVGYLDGAQDEVKVSDVIRLGGIVGLKPDRRDLAPSAKEPTAAAYGTVEAGKRQDLYYSGTLGVLGSLYEGQFDRLALLLDQRADLGPKLSLYSTSEVDFDVGASEFRTEAARLTRLDLYAVSPITRFLTLRAGLDHYERPDTRAERDQLSFLDPRFFDRGYWRYWVGGTESLPFKLRLDEEIAFIDGPDAGDNPRWRVSLTRTGLPFLPQGQVTVTGYNLEAYFAGGYGILLSAYLPFLESRLSIRPQAGFRILESEPESEEFQLTDLSIYADWWISRTFSLYAGTTYVFGDSIESTLVEFGADFRW